MHKVAAWGSVFICLACTVLAIFNKVNVRQCLNDSEPWDTHWQRARLWLVAALPVVPLVCISTCVSKNKCIGGSFALASALLIILAVFTTIYTTEYCKKDEHKFDGTLTGAELSDCFTVIAVVAPSLLVASMYIAYTAE